MNYLSLTIGPIIETLSESKKTKELFAGSYIFSYFMKNLLEELQSTKYNLIVPYHDKIDTMFKSKNGVGMFHDRLIVSNEKSQEEIQIDIDKFIESTIKKIVDGIVSINEKNNVKHKDTKSFFEKYLQISYNITDEFSLKKLTNSLDVAELHREFIIPPDDFKVLRDQEENKVNPLVYLQRKFHQSFLKDDAFGDEKSDFPSVLEIALNKSISYTYDEKTDDELEKQALKGEKNHKKYMALIQGDGDKIGAILETMDGNPENIKKFSQKLLDFSQEIPDIAKKYNARVVYAGGDDMLAFAPIIANDKKTVFDFLVELDNRFKEIMKELNIEEANHVSQSFGVSFVYYKKPLYQALNKAIYNLFDVAKSSDDRNKAVVELIKHSGQTYKVDIVLNSTIYTKFSKLLELELDSQKSALPHAVTHNLHRSIATLEALADNYHDDELISMLDNFFKNNFNKEVHSDENTDNALELTKVLLLEHLKSYQNDIFTDKKFEKYFEHFTALLSIIKHLRGDR